MLSLSMMTRCRSGTRARRYSRRPRRLPISISKPRREWLSLVCCLKWSVRPLTRSVRSAICTSGEPVSPSWVRNCSMRLFFRSTASGIDGPSIATPQEAELPRRGGFQNLFCCREIRWEGTTRGTRSKAIGRSGSGPGRRDVERDLRPERVDARELSLLPEPAGEGQGDLLVIEIAREVEHMSLD